MRAELARLLPWQIQIFGKWLRRRRTTSRWHAIFVAFLATASLLYAEGFKPRGHIHIPIGVPDTLDTLKTFVEAEGNFSPGFGTCGIAFHVYDPGAGRFFAPTMDDVPHTRGLSEPGVLIPWTEWTAGPIKVRTEVCHVQRGAVHIAASRVHLINTTPHPARVVLYATVSALGAAGAPIAELAIKDGVIFANQRPVLISAENPDGADAPAPEPGDRPIPIGKLPRDPSIQMESGTASGALLFAVNLSPAQSRSLGFISPVLHGRRAARHLWDEVSAWAQLDDADPIIGTHGIPQPAPALDFYRSLAPDEIFAEAELYWRKFRGQIRLELPDPRWGEAFHTIASHAAMCLNEGAPDVAVINYNVFNRDGVYLANIFQKTGSFDLARQVIDHFLRHPFNGRVQPEADNPGQILWLIGEHWRFTGDRTWLESVWPAAKRIAAMIEYYRTTPEPHWVGINGIQFGDDVSDGDRMRLEPGACDGFHPEYTEAFDIAGLRAALTLAQDVGDAPSRDKLHALTARLAQEYKQRFGSDLRRHEYANYCALWPCRLFPLSDPTFRDVGAQSPRSWHYFPLALAHQGLLSGNREASHRTLVKHFEIDSMRGWYALDEGGPSAPGNWGKIASSWKVENKGPNHVGSASAMPHAWSIAELHLLLRDALAFEDEDKLVLFSGVPPEWFDRPMEIRNFPTHFGSFDALWTPGASSALLQVSGLIRRPGRIVVRTPRGDQVFTDWTGKLRVTLE